MSPTGEGFYIDDGGDDDDHNNNFEILTRKYVFRLRKPSGSEAVHFGLVFKTVTKGISTHLSYLSRLGNSMRGLS